MIETIYVEESIQNHPRTEFILKKFKNSRIIWIHKYGEIFNKKNVKGLNVTTPFKKEIMDYLDYIDKIALQVGAVNTIVFDKNRKTTGYNTDWIGFKKSIKKISHKKIHSAIILGTGGASNAVAYALDKLNISYVFVSRNSNTNSINYKDLTKKLISN